MPPAEVMNVDRNVPGVLIVGAGPAGLTAALSLLRSGVCVRIIDHDINRQNLDNVGHRSAGLGILPRTLEVYNLLGLLPDILNEASPPYPIPNSMLLWATQKPDVEPTSAIPWPNRVMLSQARQEYLLRSHIEALGGKIEWGTSFVSYEPDGARIKAHLVRKGPDDVEMKEIAVMRYIIAADGAESITRRQIGLKFLAKSRRERYVIADVRVQGSDIHDARVFCWNSPKGAGRILAWCADKDSNDVLTLYISGDDVDYDALASSHCALQDFFYERTGRTDIIITKWLSTIDLSRDVGLMPTFQHNRVMLVGDAAHTHCTDSGQSLNSAIQSAFNIAWKIALVEKGVTIANLTLTYSEERVPVVAESMGLTSAIITQTFGNDDGLWRRTDADGVSQLTSHYRWSSIVFDQRVIQLNHARPAPGLWRTLPVQLLRAGDRAPDAAHLVDAARMLEALKTCPADLLRALCVLSAPPTPPTPTPAQMRSSPNADGTAAPGCIAGVYHDIEGHAHAHYFVSPETPTVVIVRPDGVVGAVVMDIAGLIIYFKAIFWNCL